MRRLLSTALILAGLLLLAEGALTLAWQEPVSGVYADFQQRELRKELERAPQARAGSLRVAARRHEVRQGKAVGRLRIPAIGLDTVVVEGTDDATLRRGPGHYPGTALPGDRGTVAIAGHRTTYGAPFRDVDDLDPGDRIELQMPYGRVGYRVERTRIVDPGATWVAEDTRTDRLVLTACHPLYSAKQRIVVFARPEVESRPHG